MLAPHAAQDVEKLSFSKVQAEQFQESLVPLVPLEPLLPLVPFVVATVAATAATAIMTGVSRVTVPTCLKYWKAPHIFE